MAEDLYWDILDDKRNKILSLFIGFKSDFYLAGGTALALQLGHRDSIDFDFFTNQSFSTNELYQRIVQTFSGHKITKNQEEKDTLTVILNENIKMSFFTYPYELIKPLISTQYFNIASVEDVGCMKLSAITSRPVAKDYVDLYFILQKISLTELLDLAKNKYPSLDTNLILKSLIYFNDIIDEPIIYKNDQETDFDLIKKSLENMVKNYLSQEKFTGELLAKSHEPTVE